jgi:hypothetical protein
LIVSLASQIRRAWFIAAKYTVTGPRIHEFTRTCRDLHTYMSLLTHKSHTHTAVSAGVVRQRVCAVPAWTCIRTWIRNLCVNPYSFTYLSGHLLHFNTDLNPEFVRQPSLVILHVKP